MQLYYFEGDNFGDRLNPFLFGALFNQVDFAERFPEHLFLGVGSILGEEAFDHIPPDLKAVVFGAGIRRQTVTRPPNILPEFVRGPLSAKRMDCPFIADAAYLLPFMKEYPALAASGKQCRVSLIPHYRHVATIDWERIARTTGINVIMPDWPVPRVLRAVAASEFVIGGAMYGCILADILRIPWARLRFRIHEADLETQLLKWEDWTGAFGLEKYPVFTMKTLNTASRQPTIGLEDELIGVLNSRVRTDEFALTGDAVFEDVIERLREAVRSFSRKFGISVNPYRTIGLQ
ncbi:MAG: polysaccharide pyruvyl transferase family protein [Deltaproteobacteria bacterium]|nr:polysaccharide pyruvyl transferase family protein [Deltaproteobacteria bacterium]